MIVVVLSVAGMFMFAFVVGTIAGKVLAWQIRRDRRRGR